MNDGPQNETEFTGTDARARMLESVFAAVLCLSVFGLLASISMWVMS